MKRINQVAATSLPTDFGDFRLIVYQSPGESGEHVALIKGDISKSPTLVRVHSKCLTGDTLFSSKCDCGQQLRMSLKKIQEEGNGILIYLDQEGRGVGLTSKIKAYALQEKGYDTVEANEALGLPVDARDYNTAALILKDLGIAQINLLTNNPDKIKQLAKYGIKIAEITPLEVSPNDINHSYLSIKKTKLGHTLRQV